MNLIVSHKVSQSTEKIRFLDYVLKNIKEITSRNGAKKAIKKGLLLLDGKQVESGRYVNYGQLIEYFNEDKPPTKIYELPLDIIYEDEQLAVIDKPAGLSVSGNYFRTLQNALPFNLKPSTDKDTLTLARPVHRLDNQTSGLIIVAKTQTALINLGKQFENKEIEKTYNAIVCGNVIGSNEIIKDIDNKPSTSKYKSILNFTHKYYGTLSLLKLIPTTGRTHQLRIHLASIGHPILGDKIYSGDNKYLKGKGLFLCAISIKFRHPTTNEYVYFSREMPNKFKKILSQSQHNTEIQ